MSKIFCLEYGWKRKGKPGAFWTLLGRIGSKICLREQKIITAFNYDTVVTFLKPLSPSNLGSSFLSIGPAKLLWLPFFIRLRVLEAPTSPQVLWGCGTPLSVCLGKHFPYCLLLLHIYSHFHQIENIFPLILGASPHLNLPRGDKVYIAPLWLPLTVAIYLKAKPASSVASKCIFFIPSIRRRKTHMSRLTDRQVFFSPIEILDKSKESWRIRLFILFLIVLSFLFDVSIFNLTPDIRLFAILQS